MQAVRSFQTSPNVIRSAVTLSVRFPLSPRNVAGPTGPTLFIAALDRLSPTRLPAHSPRQRVAFLAVDMPEANGPTVDIMALVAEAERKAIPRTKRGPGAAGCSVRVAARRV